MARRIPSLGEQLRKHRDLMGYSIREAAKAAKIAPIRLSQWERDIRKPSIDNISVLAVVYRVLIDELCLELRHRAIQTQESRFESLPDSDKPP